MEPADLYDRVNYVTGVRRVGTSHSSTCWRRNPPYVGQSVIDLFRRFGHPSATEVIESTRKKREVHKFFPRGANRFGLRVTVENDVVVAWKGT